jgi:hypothetical protein
MEIILAIILAIAVFWLLKKFGQWMEKLGNGLCEVGRSMTEISMSLTSAAATHKTPTSQREGTDAYLEEARREIEDLVG